MHGCNSITIYGGIGGNSDYGCSRSGSSRRLGCCCMDCSGSEYKVVVVVMAFVAIMAVVVIAGCSGGSGGSDRSNRVA